MIAAIVSRVKISLNPFKRLILITIIIGIFFRFAHLDQKVFWGDETFSALRMAGYTLTEVEQNLINKPATSNQTLQHYLQVNPEKTWRDTLHSLATEDPHHTPLYFMIGRVWQQLLGTSLAVQRSLSVVLSLLIFPSIYWLCRELFNSSLSGWVAMGIVAVSPFHVLYAQEVRQYSLWTVLILASSAALLTAIRFNQKKYWWLYSLTVALGLYTHLFYSLVAIGHGIYIIFTQRRFNPILKSYSLSALVSLCLFSPWLWVVIHNLSRVKAMNTGHTESIPLLDLIQNGLLNLSRIFIDLDSQGRILLINNNGSGIILQGIILLGLTLLMGYSLFHLYQKTKFKQWFFIVILISLTSLALLIPDLVSGGIRSTYSRYLIPVYLGIQLSISHLISYQLEAPNLNPTVLKVAGTRTEINSKFIGKLLLILFLSVGTLSCGINSQAKSWWTKGGSYHHPEIAQIINQAANPLLISSDKIPRVLSLTYLLKPTVKVQFVQPGQLPPIPAGFTLFLYAPSPAFQTEIEKLPTYSLKKTHRFSPIYQYLEPLAKHSDLWLCEFVNKD